ncbi:MAG: SAM-dependent methyltransferase [Thermodesulfobacteriota bacterium]
MKSYDQLLTEHYGQSDLETRILSALEKAGKDINTLTREDLFTFDEFHIGGRLETRKLAEWADLKPGTRVLDLGCGIGGPARTLADEFKCDVTGLDIIEDYCTAAQSLTRRVGLADRVRFQHGDVAEMPFDPETFDAVWSQHTTMNIEDKQALFREIYRVLVPGGRFIFHEVCAGLNQPIHFPVPWAHEAALNFLTPPRVLHRSLTDQGLTEEKWRDITADSLAWYQKAAAKMATRQTKTAKPLGIKLLMGDTTPSKAANVVKNLEEDRIRVVQGIFRKNG